MLLLALVYPQFAAHPGVVDALRGMGAVVAGLIVATGLKLFGALKANPLGIPVRLVPGAACFVTVALLRWPFAYRLLVVGTAACDLYALSSKAWRPHGGYTADRHRLASGLKC